MVQGWISNIVKSSATTYYSGILDHSFNRLLTSSKNFYSSSSSGNRSFIISRWPARKASFVGNISFILSCKSSFDNSFVSVRFLSTYNPATLPRSSSALLATPYIPFSIDASRILTSIAKCLSLFTSQASRNAANRSWISIAISGCFRQSNNSAALVWADDGE